MTISTQRATPTLYEQDFYLWLKTTAEQLKKGEFAEVDLDNLIEEIESMGRRTQVGLKYETQGAHGLRSALTHPTNNTKSGY
jgi:hypothetical protein